MHEGEQAAHKTRQREGKRKTEAGTMGTGNFHRKGWKERALPVSNKLDIRLIDSMAGPCTPDLRFGPQCTGFGPSRLWQDAVDYADCGKHVKASSWREGGFWVGLGCA